MKKIILWLMITAGLLLLSACGPENGAEPTQIPEHFITPTTKPVLTDIVSPTIGLSITPTPDLEPSATPSPIPSVTPSPEPSATPTPAPGPEPSATPSPSPTPDLEPSATPDLTPGLEPSATPIPTLDPEPSVTPSPTPSATPSPSPTPTVNPEPLVLNGWQKVVSIDEMYGIVFPELFRDSEVSRTDRELLVTYTSKENTEIKFMIQYVMMQTLEETVEEIFQMEGACTEQFPEEQRISYLLPAEGMMYRGILLEAQYSRELLGDSFGEEEEITGIMNVIFAYPAEDSLDYQTEQYAFYVVQNREEN